MSFEAWLVIIFVGVFTYLTRALPFVWKSRWMERASESAWLERLGPAMLVAMMVAVGLPFAQGAMAQGSFLPLALGVLAVLGALAIKPNAGLATLAGVGAFWLGAVLS